VAWYRKHARALPWRATRDPYAIWVSEIMLQQTQVATVIPYYERFLARFPDVGGLAAAAERDVLRLWEGLGYYRRARQMHAAAKRIAAEHGGEFPADFEAIRALPGIGRYTAGAIASFAFDARRPILEANTTRLFARLLAFGGDTAGREGQMLLWTAAESILPRRGAGLVNQALMELGSQVCTPREPRCSQCPLASLCPTRRDRLQDVIPRPKSKPQSEEVREAAVVIRDRGRVLLVERAAGQRWAALWDFPRFGVNADGVDLAQDLAAKVARSCSLQIVLGAPLTTLRHGVTRFRITLEVFGARLCKCAERNGSTNGHTKRHACNGESEPSFAQQRWVRIGELSEYPLSTTGRKIAELLQRA
jgi:A/G-specific adenine glycosylase